MIRVAELLGSLSLATDLADGFALEKSLRTTVIASRLARCVDADQRARTEVFWTALLRFYGCTAFAHEEGKRFSAGEDIALRRSLAFVDFGRPQTFLKHALRDVAAHAPLKARAKAVANLLWIPAAIEHAHAQCEASAHFARELGMIDVAHIGLRTARWDGRGPRQKKHDAELPLSVRVADVADVIELFTWSFGVEEARAELKRRSGGELDPSLVAPALAALPEILGALFEEPIWERFLAEEPPPHRTANTAAEITRLLDVFSRFPDLFSAYTLDHSRAVADLAAIAASHAGLDAELTRQAALAHDIGRVAVPNGIWEKRGSLTPYERERVRTHSQQTETVLRLASGLQTVADIASMTHERGAGHGYHRRLALEHVPQIARIVAAADVYVALRSDRPHRPAFSASDAEHTMLTEIEKGALDRQAARAVLDAAGHARPRRGAWPNGLTDREIEVIRLVAIGRTNKEIGALLGMSPRTAQKHVMNVYDKLGLESRAGLALFAMEHRLLDH